MIFSCVVSQKSIDSNGIFSIFNVYSFGYSKIDFRQNLKEYLLKKTKREKKRFRPQKKIARKIERTGMSEYISIVHKIERTGMSEFSYTLESYTWVQKGSTVLVKFCRDIENRTYLASLQEQGGRAAPLPPYPPTPTL